MSKKIKLFSVGIIFLSLPVFVSAVSVGERADFFVDPSFDSFQREETTATLQRISPDLYFYIDDNWWRLLDYQEGRECYQCH